MQQLTLCGTLRAATCNRSLQWNASHFAMLCLHSVLARTAVGICFFFLEKMCLKFIKHLWSDVAHTVKYMWPPLIQMVLKLEC